MDREVIRCKSCGLVQYRTSSGNCRRCVRLLPPKVEFLIPPPATQELPRDDRQIFAKRPITATAETNGHWIRPLQAPRCRIPAQLPSGPHDPPPTPSRIETS